MNKLVLFDIDGTLIKNSEGHKTAFSEAFKRVYDITTTIDIINHPGMTDQQIIREVLKKNGVDDKTITSGLHDCIKVMVDIFNRVVVNDELIVIGGVRELLKELHERNVLLGLVTGNLEEIARGKLRKVGLNHFFRLGGFGSDDIHRSNLIHVAVKRAQENFGFKTNENVFVIGDTVRDIEAGQKAKVMTVGVATGIYSKQDLEHAGADFVFEDLENTEEVLKIMV